MDFKILGLAGLVATVGCMDMNMSFDQGVRGSGTSATEHRKVDAFSRIDMKGAYDVEVTVGPKTSIDITGDDNLVKLVETTVDHETGTLTLSTKKNVHPTKGLKVIITTPSLSAFTLKGAGDVNIDGLHGDEFNVNLSGAGDLTAKGNVNSVVATLHGAGDMNLYDVHASNVDADLSGAGDMKVWASKYLKAKMSGVGDLTYKGHPATVDKTKSGVGDISAED